MPVLAPTPGSRPRRTRARRLRRAAHAQAALLRAGAVATGARARATGERAIVIGGQATREAFAIGEAAVDGMTSMAQALVKTTDIPLTALDGWRRFVSGPYRRWAALAAGQGAVGALAGVAIILPLLLSQGVGAAAATLLATLVLAGPIAQLVVPRLLRAGNGDLRRLTLAAAGVGETRGLWLAAIAAGAYAGLLPAALLVPVCALALLVAGVFSGVAAANVQAWLAATLPEPERRFVAPRVATVSMAAGAVVLLAAAAVLSSLGQAPGPGAYATLFGLAGVIGLFELAVLRRLPRPGRVLVPRLAESPVADPTALRNFLRNSALAAAGSGLAPYMSTYAIVVLAAPAGIAVALSAATSASAVLAGMIAADFLASRSSSRLLRASWLAIAAGWLAAFAAAPIFPFALSALFTSAIIVAAAAAVAGLAVTERLFRLAPGPAAIAVQGRFVALNAAGTAGGQLAAVALLAAGPAGFAPFGALFALSAGARLAAAGRLRVADSWSSATGVFRHEDLGIATG